VSVEARLAQEMRTQMARAEAAERKLELMTERCDLLNRVIKVLWALVGEEDRKAINALLAMPPGDGKTRPATAIISDDEYWQHKREEDSRAEAVDRLWDEHWTM